MAAALDDALASSIAAFQSAWNSWANCILAAAAANDIGGEDAVYAAQGVANAANLARAAMVHLARKRTEWQRNRGHESSTDEPTAEAPTNRAHKRKVKGHDPLELKADDTASLADFKRGLREVAEKVRKVVRARGQDQQTLDQLRNQVQQLAEATAGSGRATTTNAVEDTPTPTPTRTSHATAPLYYPGASPQGRRGTGDGRRRTTRGRHEANKPQFVEVFFANVTSFSEKAKTRLTGAGAPVWIAVETHMRGTKLDGEVSKLANAGWHCTYSDAALSDRSDSGTQGGALAAARGHLCARPMAGDAREAHGHRSSTDDMVGLNIPLRGAEILVFGSYAREGRYMPHISAVAQATLQGRIPFIWLGDFNTTAEAMEVEPALAALDAVVVRPGGGRISCHQGAGSLIDFAIVSRHALPLVELDLVPDVPWSPHDGLRLRIRKCVKAITVKKLAKPLRYDHEEVQLVADEPWEIPWPEAKRIAQDELKHINLETDDALVHQRCLMNDLGALRESIELGKQVMVWSRATEIQALAAKGVDPTARAARKAMGRALPPRFYNAPILRRRCDPGPQRLPGGYTDDARLWATLRVLFGKLRKALAAGQPDRTAVARANLIRAAACGEGATWRAWLAVTSAANDNAARMAIYRACDATAGPADVEVAEALLARLEHEAVKTARDAANHRWQTWVADSLRGGELELRTDGLMHPTSHLQRSVRLVATNLGRSSSTTRANGLGSG